MITHVVVPSHKAERKTNLPLYYHGRLFHFAIQTTGSNYAQITNRPHMVDLWTNAHGHYTEPDQFLVHNIPCGEIFTRNLQGHQSHSRFSRPPQLRSNWAPPIRPTSTKSTSLERHDYIPLNLRLLKFKVYNIVKCNLQNYLPFPCEHDNVKHLSIATYYLCHSNSPQSLLRIQ